MKRLYSYYLSYSDSKILILFIVLVQYGASVAAPFVFGSLIESLTRDVCLHSTIACTVLLLVTLNAVGIFAERMYTCRVEKETARMALKLKEEALEVYHHMDAETRGSRSPAEWEHRIAVDSMTIASCACPLFSSFHGATISFLLTFGIVITERPIFILPCIICATLFSVLLKHRRSRLETLNRQCRVQSYREYTTLLDILSLKSVMRVFQVTPFLSKRYRDDAFAYSQKQVEATCFTAAYTSEIRLLIWFTDSSVLVLSLYLFFRNIIGIDSLIAYGLLLNRITSQMGHLLYSIPQFSRGTECAAAMDEYRQYALPQKTESESPKISTELDKDELVRFCGAGFCYRGLTEPILKNLNVSIQRNEYTTIMGINGAGKSTLIKLLLGELQAGEGKIQSCVKRPGYVPQNIAVFRGTLRENLTLCNSTISPAAIDNVIRKTHLQSLVARIGLDSQISQEQLSGGELQRIGIARALIIDPDLLVIDEVTNHLDIVNKELIFSFLKSLRSKCAIIAISHDAEALQDSDRCLLLKGGTLTTISGSTAEERRANLYRCLSHEL